MQTLTEGFSVEDVLDRLEIMKDALPIVRAEVISHLDSKKDKVAISNINTVFDALERFTGQLQAGVKGKKALDDKDKKAIKNYVFIYNDVGNKVNALLNSKGTKRSHNLKVGFDMMNHAVRVISQA